MRPRGLAALAVMIVLGLASACAVSVDDREHQQMMIDRVFEADGVRMDFPLLSDPDHRVINRYGIFNMEDPRGREIAHPATFVIDDEGVVRWRFVEVNHRTRPSNEDILAELEKL